MATATRIYHVNLEGNQFLVRASHPNAALMHVARSVSAVRVASQDDLVNCLADGVKVESAKEETAAPEPEPATDKAPSLPLWPMPTPVSSGFTDMPTPRPEVDDDDDDDQEVAAGAAASRPRAPAKFRDPLTGSTWSGRGLKPTWLRVALATGSKTLADFEVKTENVQA